MIDLYLDAIEYVTTGRSDSPTWLGLRVIGVVILIGLCAELLIG